MKPTVSSSSASSLLLVLLLATASSLPVLAQENYKPVSLSLTVYSDGVVHISYVLTANPELPNVTFPLFGLHIEGLIVVDENETFLDYTLKDSIINVDSLGASEITVEYDTQTLTNKTGQLWTLAIDAPIDFTVTFPTETTIVEVSQAPTEIMVEEQHQILVMPAGLQSISYIVGAVGPKAQASRAITRAEQIIADIKAKGIILTNAEGKLADSKTAYEAGDYEDAETLANQAVNLAYSTEQNAESAYTAIRNAQTAIEEARKQGRTDGLNEAERLLQQSKNEYNQGKYVEAKNLANQAIIKAQEAKPPFPVHVIALAASIAIATLAAILLLRKRREEKVDANGIIKKNPWLRPEQRSIIILLAEKGGGAFESEIRNMLNLPKSTVWRLIKRLEEEEIVEIQQIRRQNYVRLKKRRKLSS